MKHNTEMSRTVAPVLLCSILADQLHADIHESAAAPRYNQASSVRERVECTKKIHFRNLNTSASVEIVLVAVADSLRRSFDFPLPTSSLALNLLASLSAA